MSALSGLSQDFSSRALHPVVHLSHALAQLKACLQKVPPVYITSLTYNFSFGPVIDKVRALPHHPFTNHPPPMPPACVQVTITEDPEQSLAAGRINHVAVIMGAQTNDSNKELLPDYEDAFGITLLRICPAVSCPLQYVCYLRGNALPTHPMPGNLLPITAKAYEAQVAQEVDAKFLKEALALYPPTEGVPFVGRCEGATLPLRVATAVLPCPFYSHAHPQCG